MITDPAALTSRVEVIARTLGWEGHLAPAGKGKWRVLLHVDGREVASFRGEDPVGAVRVFCRGFSALLPYAPRTRRGAVGRVRCLAASCAHWHVLCGDVGLPYVAH